MLQKLKCQDHDEAIKAALSAPEQLLRTRFAASTSLEKSNRKTVENKL